MSGLDLPDLNVWLALADADHEHHVRARHYWETEAADQLAFCRVTRLGLLRLLTNRKVMHDAPLTPDEAWRTYQGFMVLPEVAFLNEPADAEKRMSALSHSATFSPHRWTDAWLASLALTAGARMVSFDRDFQTFSGLSFLHLTR